MPLCFEHYCANHQEVKIVLYSTGIITPVDGRPVHRTATYGVKGPFVISVCVR